MRATVGVWTQSGLRSSCQRKRVVDAIETGDGTQEPVTNWLKGGGVTPAMPSMPVEPDAMRVARPVRGRLVGVTLADFRQVESQRSIPSGSPRRNGGDRDIPRHACECVHEAELTKGGEAEAEGNHASERLQKRTSRSVATRELRRNPPAGFGPKPLSCGRFG